MTIWVNEIQPHNSGTASRGLKFRECLAYPHLFMYAIWEKIELVHWLIYLLHQFCQRSPLPIRKCKDDGWNKVLVRRVKWLSTTVTKTMYVCFIWLPCRRFHLEEGMTMTARSGVRLGSLLQAGFWCLSRHLISEVINCASLNSRPDCLQTEVGWSGTWCAHHGQDRLLKLSWTLSEFRGGFQSLRFLIDCRGWDWYCHWQSW